MLNMHTCCCRRRSSVFALLVSMLLAALPIIMLLPPVSAAAAEKSVAAPAGAAVAADKAVRSAAMSALASEKSAGHAVGETSEMPDPDRNGSLAVTFTYYDETTGKRIPVAGGNSVGLYKVADVVVDNGFRFAVDSRFASIGEIPETSEELDRISIELAEKMAAIAEEYAFDVAPAEMDADGKVSFSDLSVGLYLVVQASTGSEGSRYAIAPFLVSIPMRGTDGKLIYDVDGSTKPIGIARHDTPPEPEPPRPPFVPQTGQLWWPVMVFGAVGAVLIAVGIVRKWRG